MRATGLLMAGRQAFREFDDIALEWRALAERRRTYFTELYDSGRWKLYYTKEQYVVRVREVVSTAAAWARIAPLPAEIMQGVARNTDVGAPTFARSSDLPLPAVGKSRD